MPSSPAVLSAPGTHMNINDPFGRLAKRHQTGYESIRASLQQAGINTPQAAREIIRKTNIRSLKIVGSCLLALLLIAALLPKMLPVALGIAFLILVWITTWVINGRRYIKRYIDEDLNPEAKSK
jgi:hypothetical protein